MRPFILVFLLLTIWLAASPARAFHAQVQRLDAELPQAQRLAPLYFQLLPEHLILEDVLADPAIYHSFQPLPSQQNALLAPTGQATWLFVRLDYQGSTDLQAVLDYPFPLADRVTLYQVNRSNQRFTKLQRTGTDYPFSMRQIPSRSFATRLTLQAGEQHDIYIKIQDAALTSTVLSLWSEPAFHAHQQQLDQTDWFIQGMLWLLVLFALTAYRQPSQRYLAGFFAALAMVVATLNGLAFAWLWPEQPEINHSILYIFAGTSLLCLNAFIQHGLLLTKQPLSKILAQFNALLAWLLLFSPLYAQGQQRLYLLIIISAFVLLINLLQAVRFSLATISVQRRMSWLAQCCIVTSMLLCLVHTSYLVPAEGSYSTLQFIMLLLCVVLLLSLPATPNNQGN
ncbi:7TM-DISM domain-containing protein [Arsukibacterium sp.]|uniref:7TM-DISM domain-containing protein n=1 Tax=Arsukibacterium sp. TaxID=1977258 RepID=UPI002FD8E8E1